MVSTIVSWLVRSSTLILLFATSALFAGDWPQWRGPERDGVAAPGAVLPTDLPAQLRRVWQVEVG
ncbi:MAG: hypothetical protein O7A98_10695, partial [Acidobacteria bacterium]|nr:hypothetical protein [Acidobacteriota bacterium]